MSIHIKKIKNFYQVCEQNDEGKDKVICTVYKENDANIIAIMFELQRFTTDNYNFKS